MLPSCVKRPLLLPASGTVETKPPQSQRWRWLWAPRPRRAVEEQTVKASALLAGGQEQALLISKFTICLKSEQEASPPKREAGQAPSGIPLKRLLSLSAVTCQPLCHFWKVDQGTSSQPEPVGAVKVTERKKTRAFHTGKTRQSPRLQVPG